jgi:hypothetical protein
MYVTPVPICHSRVRSYEVHSDALLRGVFAGTFPCVPSSADAYDLGVEERVAAEDLPTPRQAARGAHLEAAHLDVARQLVHAGRDLRARVVLVDLEDRRGDRQVAVQEIPLRAELELPARFGIEALLAVDERQRFERRVERCSVRSVKRLRVGGLVDEAGAHARVADRLARRRRQADRVGKARVVPVVADAGDAFQVSANDIVSLM